MVKTPIYLDYQATTPMADGVLDAMMPFFQEKFGNPHSTAHRFGWETSAAIDVARGHIASLIGADEGDIIFTSGATESNNFAIKGVMEAFQLKKPHMITLASEHSCVLNTARYITERTGGDVSVLPVKADGLIDLDQLKDALRRETALVSVMAVNNEIGVIQPLNEIGTLVKENGSLFHTDAAQAFGKIPLDVEASHIDLLSISGHKIYGPKGIGALYVRQRPKVPLIAHMHGGGQEKGIRSGTLAPALCVGLGKAAEIALKSQGDDEVRMTALRQRFLDLVASEISDLKINGTMQHRISSNLNIMIPNLDNQKLISKLRDVAISSGSACATGKSTPSHVLTALGLSANEAKSSLRIGFGRQSTEEEVIYAAEKIIAAVKAQRG